MSTYVVEMKGKEGVTYEHEANHVKSDGNVVSLFKDEFHKNLIVSYDARQVFRVILKDELETTLHVGAKVYSCDEYQVFLGTVIEVPTGRVLVAKYTWYDGCGTVNVMCFGKGAFSQNGPKFYADTDMIIWSKTVEDPSGPPTRCGARGVES